LAAKVLNLPDMPAKEMPVEVFQPSRQGNNEFSPLLPDWCAEMAARRPWCAVIDDGRLPWCGRTVGH
jgi:hypothetical protein